MVVTETAAGTPIVEMDEREYEAHIERAVKDATSLSAAEFRNAYAHGKLDDSDPAVSELVGLLRIGQNGHSGSA